jgi:hypothetical protein
MKFKQILLIPFLLMFLVTWAWAGGYTVQYKGGSSISTSNIDFSGAGQNDIELSGTYTGSVDACYEVQATATGTYKWRADCNSGAYTTGVSMSTTATELEKGINARWLTATGHTNTDLWKFKVKAYNPIRVQDPAGKNLMSIDNDGKFVFLSSIITSNNAFVGMRVDDSIGANYLKLNREFVDVAGTVALTAADSGKTFTNDTNGAKSYTLPPAAVGLRFSFYNDSGQSLTIVENGGDTIVCGASSSGVSIAGPTAGDYISLLGISDSEWGCTAYVPLISDWTFN